MALRIFDVVGEQFAASDSDEVEARLEFGRKLKRNDLGEILALLTSSVKTQNERTALLEYALAGCSALDEIDYSGSPRAFLIRAVNKLMEYGNCEPGKSALMMFLQGCRANMGIDRQQRIDALCKTIFGD